MTDRQHSTDSVQKCTKDEPAPTTCFSSFFTMSTAITICGILFDFFQVSLSLADVASDVLVCIEFHQNNHTAFFALVLTTLTITSIANAIIFSLRIGYIRSIHRDQGYKFLGLIPLIIVGLLLPPVNYIITKCNVPLMREAWGYTATSQWDTVGKQIEEERKKNMKKKHDNIDGEEEADGDEAKTENDESKDTKNTNKNTKKRSRFATATSGGVFATAAFKILQEKVASEHAVIGMLDRAVVERFMSYFLLNSMTLTESIPQIIVQLIAVSIFEEVTTVQVVSLTLSMFSVACKAFQLCRSFAIKAFFCKIFLLAHDLFSMAFLFSVLLAANTPRTTTFFFLPEDSFFPKINVVSNIWIMIKIINCCIWAILGLWLWIFIYFEDFVHNKKNFFCGSALFFFLGCVGIGPALLVHEAVKLTWLIVFNYFHSPSASDFPLCSILHEFLHDSDGKERFPTIDWRLTFAALSKKIKTSAAHRAANFNPEKYKIVRNRWYEALDDSAHNSIQFRFRHSRAKETNISSHCETSANNVSSIGSRYPNLASRPSKEEIRAVEYHSPFLSITIPGGLQIDSNALMQACLKPFTKDSARVDPMSSVDLLTEKEKYEDEEKAKKEAMMKRKEEVNQILFGAAENDDNAGDEDDEEDSLATRLLMNATSSSPREDENYNYGSSTSAIINDVPEPKIEDVSPPENKSNTIISIRKVRDNHIQRARHSLLVQSCFNVARQLSDNAFVASGTEPSASFYHHKKHLNNWDAFTAGCINYFDPYKQFSITELAGLKTISALLTDAKDFVTDDNIFNEPRPMMIFVTAITFFISSLAGLLFPIVYAALYFEHFSLMQKICWYSAMGSLLGALLLSKSFYDYQFSCMFWKNFSSRFYSCRMSASGLMQIIDSYFSLPLATLQQSVAPRNKNVVPEDCFLEHVLPFLTAKQVGLYGVVDKDFVKTQEEILANLE